MIRRVFLVAVILTVTVRVTPQVESAQLVEGSLQGFNVDVISFASESRTVARLDVFTQVSYDELAFVKRDDLYEASYDITVAVYDEENRLVGERVWTEKVKPVPFETSVSPRVHSYTQRSFELTHGNYGVLVMLRDNETKTSRRLSRQITVPDYSRTPLMLSDIMLVARITAAGTRQIITPSVSANVGVLTDPFFAFFEAYADSGLDSVVFTTKILDNKGEQVLAKDTSYYLPVGRNQVFITVDHRALQIGEYVLMVLCRKEGSDEELATTNRRIHIRWSGLPRSVKDIDEAIAQTAYIAKENELKQMKEAPSPAEKQRRFQEFWKAKDPNPNTPRNERMEQYYSRVEYTNKNFSRYRPGWKTDMGMVFILFGSPNTVDRYPFEVNSKPYEVWTYHEINYSFVFVDESGFGDYRLTTPIHEVWKRYKE